MLKDLVARGPSKPDSLQTQGLTLCRGFRARAWGLTEMVPLWELQQKALPRCPRSPGRNPDVQVKALLCRLPSAESAGSSISQRCSEGTRNFPVSLPLAIPSGVCIASHPVHTENEREGKGKNIWLTVYSKQKNLCTQSTQII